MNLTNPSVTWNYYGSKLSHLERAERNNRLAVRNEIARPSGLKEIECVDEGFEITIAGRLALL